VAHRVVFAPEAERDLTQLYDFLEEQSGHERALGYLEQVIAYCEGFSDFPERGTLRSDLWPGLRITGFERRVTIAFHVTEDAVTIDRIFYGGRNWESILSEDK
jgi:toxin ParE1/3/4